MTRKLMLLIAFLVLVHITGILPGDSAKADLPGLAVGIEAPDFQLKDLQGHTVKLSDFRGKKVMLNFWAPWCPPCKQEMPEMQKFHEAAGNEVSILAVNIDPQYNSAKFLGKMGITFPILLDGEDKVNTQYGVMTIPTTFFIDEKGIIQDKYLSAMEAETMWELTEKMK
jgi:peroxiredoxin